jgi:hypothetical protein
MVAWLHALGQNIMATGVSEASLPHGSQGAEKKEYRNISYQGKIQSPRI